MKTNWGTGIDMTPFTRRTSVIVLILCMALPAWGQQYLLYTPQPATSGQPEPSKDDILVKEIVIQKGDTLSALSRKFSGHGMYYPQILLFNSIKNPNLIYTGKMLRVPVARKSALAAETGDAGPGAKPRMTKGSVDKQSTVKAEEELPGDSAAASSVEPPARDVKVAGTPKNKAKSGRKKKKGAAAPALKKTSQEVPSGVVSTATPSSQQPEQNAAAPSSTAPDNRSGQKLFEAAVKAYRLEDCRTALELFDRYLADNSGSPLAADATLYKAECYMKLSAQ